MAGDNTTQAVSDIEKLQKQHKDETGQQLVNDVNKILKNDGVTSLADKAVVTAQLVKDGVLPALLVAEANGGKSDGQFKYGSDGHLQSISGTFDGQKDTFTYKDGKWSLNGQDAGIQGDIQVNPDGSFSFNFADDKKKERWTFNADGTFTSTPEQQQLTLDSMTQAVNQIENAILLKREAGGTLVDDVNKILNANDITFKAGDPNCRGQLLLNKLEADGVMPKLILEEFGKDESTFFKYSADGQGLTEHDIQQAADNSTNPTEKMLLQGFINDFHKINPGDHAEITFSDLQKWAQSSDSITHTLKGPGGSTITVDGGGHVSEIDYANGTKREFTYNGDALSTITEVSGFAHGKKAETFTYDPETGRWKDPAGKDTGNYNVSLSADGTYSYTDSKGVIHSIDAAGTSSHMNIIDQPGVKKTADGSNTIYTLDGHVIEVEGANKKTWRYGYDSNGNVNHITEPGGAEYNLGSSKVWYDSKGNSTGNTDVSVNPNTGDLLYKTKSGEQIIQHVDGTKFDGTESGKSAIIFDHHQVSEIDYPDGSKRTFTYKDGALSTITETNSHGSSKYKYDPNSGEWKDPNGKDTGNFNASISADGTYSYTDSTGIVHTTAPDGKTTAVALDAPAPGVVANELSNGNITYTANGRILEVKSPTGQKWLYGYGGTDGTILNHITEPGGATYHLADKEHWFDSSGKDTGNTGVSIDQTTGDLLYETGNKKQVKQLSDGSKVQLNADGTSTRYNTDHSIVKLDNSNPPQVTEVDYPDHRIRKFFYDSTGKCDKVEEGKPGQLTTYSLDSSTGYWKHNDQLTDNSHLNVNADGSYSFEQGNTLVTCLTNDTRILTNGDKNVTGIVYADGTSRSFNYKDGVIVSVVASDGHGKTKTYQPNGSGEWSTDNYTFTKLSVSPTSGDFTVYQGNSLTGWYEVDSEKVFKP